MMKASKYTQASSPIDNEYRDYQNIEVTRFSGEERNKNILNYPREDIATEDTTTHCHNANTSSEFLLKSNYDPFKTPENERSRFEGNANAGPVEDLEMMCNCAIKDVVFPLKNRFRDSNSEQNLVLNRSFTSIPKLESANLSQYSLDRRTGKFHGNRKHMYGNEREYGQKFPQRFHDRNVMTMKRIQSPEIINIHRGPNSSIIYDGYESEHCSMKSCGREKDGGCDDYGFQRQRSFRVPSRSDVNHTGTVGHPRRPPGDGMVQEMEDPEHLFGITEQLAECHCPYERMLYSPGFTTCLQDEHAFPPAPDVTRRMATPTSFGKLEPGASPPYYRAASATSSTSNSAKIEMSTRHWYIIIIVLLFAAAAGVGVPIALKISSSASYDERLEFATRLLQEVPLIDGHNDLPWNIRKFLHNKLKNFKFNEDLRHVSPWSTSSWSHTDLLRLEQGRIAAQFWAAYVPCDAQYKDAVQLTLEQIDVIRRLTELYHPRLALCTSSEEIMRAHKDQKLCSLIGVEGGHSLAGSLGVLRSLYHIGVRYLTLTSTCNTPWADCSLTDMPGRKPEHGGLTAFGKTIIKEMNRLGMIVDLSHVSVGTMRDALDVSKAPVIFSHSSAYSLCNASRNVNDETLKRIALNRGIVMVNFYSHFLTCSDTSTVADAVAHINHIREVAGVDNVGLGAGYDGINYVPQGLEDVSSYPNLFAELIGTGKWNVEDLKKLAGLNFIRVFREVEKVRDEFKKANVPPYEDVMMPRPKDNNCTSQEHF